MITQLNPPIPLDTPKGKALAHFVIDYGPEHNLMWVTFVDATGECWTWPNYKIRAQKNITMGRLTGEDAPTPVLMESEVTMSANGKNSGLNLNGAH
jgi:hypothetical protein